MSTNIFDLGAVKELIVDKQPAAVVVMDTNVVMDYPEFAKWNTSLGEVMFVLPALYNLEAERVKRKSQDKESRAAAIQAIRAYSDLCEKGLIHRGIHVDGAGWFISVPLPMEDRMTPALKQWAWVVQEYNRPDVLFLLLTMELAQLSCAPVILATGDQGLHGFASGQGVTAHRVQGFPMTISKASLPEPPSSGIDFEQLKAYLKREAEKKKVVSVELTLAARREIPRPFGRTLDHLLEDIPLPDSPLLLAEGTGAVDRQVPFSWALSYSEWDYPRPEAEEGPDLRTEFFAEAYLDFAGREHEVSDDIKKALAEKLERLTFPLAGWLGSPTVLGPESILKYFFYITYVEGSLSSQGGTEDEMKKEFAEEYLEASSLADFGARVVFWRLGVDPEEGRVGDALTRLFVALAASWDIGNRTTLHLVI